MIAVTAVAGCDSAERPRSAPVPTPPPTPFPVAVPQLQLSPPPYTVNVDEPSSSAGYVLLNNGGFNPAAAVLNPDAAPAAAPPVPGGPQIVDKQGRVVWFGQLPAGQSAANFQVQTYAGQPVLTWWQGDLGGPDTFGHGNGVDYIVDAHYRVIATLSPQGLHSDVHEFRLTPDGHALITAYTPVPADLTAVGGPKDGKVWDCVAAVVDVASGKTLSQWSALAHVPVTDSALTTADAAAYRGGVFDAFHMNSIALAPDGDLLISMRHTSTVYKVSPSTGQIAWQLGGKHSTFALQPGVQFAFQHDAQFADPHTIRLFNNDTDGADTLGQSSIEWIRLDEAAHTATLVRNQTHPGGVQTFAMGNAQPLPNGNTFGGWGTGQHISEFGPSGELVYDAQTPQGATYRAFLQEWRAEPTEPPQVSIATGDRPTVTAVWNGATQVRQWRVLAGDSATALHPVATAEWAGLATTIPVSPAAWFQVQALDRSGSVIATSEPTRR
ncbi:hypothetical protein E2F47_08315 [Mycobacterium eburneum]|nr:hypothetical protein E2F47_08315 [Mycobacterium eburneum]